MNSKIFSFSELPLSVSDIPKNVFDSPFDVAAMTLTVLCNYNLNSKETLKMLDHLRGKHPMNLFEKIFLKDRLAGKGYIPFSYFDGADRHNGYKTVKPYSFEVYATPSSYIKDDMVRLYIQSHGSKKAGTVTLRYEEYRWYLAGEDLLTGILMPMV